MKRIIAVILIVLTSACSNKKPIVVPDEKNRISEVPTVQNNTGHDSESEKPLAPVFDGANNRIITVETWASTLGFAFACTVTEDEAVVFTRNDFGKPERELARNKVQKGMVTQMRNRIDEIPKELYGKQFYREGVHGGIFFRFSFSPDGSLSNDRIEFENANDQRLFPIIELIETVAPCGSKFTSPIRPRFERYPLLSRPV